MVSQRYGITEDNATRWYHSTEWAIHGWVSNKMLRSVVYSLKAAGIIEQKEEIPQLVWKRGE